MIAKGSRPKFACLHTRRQAPDIARGGTFRDVAAGLQEFAMDPGGAPGWIILHHLPYEPSDLSIDYRFGKLIGSGSEAPNETLLNASRQWFLV